MTISRYSSATCGALITTVASYYSGMASRYETVEREPYVVHKRFANDIKIPEMEMPRPVFNACIAGGVVSGLGGLFTMDWKLGVVSLFFFVWSMFA